jgi:hypothetical protein
VCYTNKFRNLHTRNNSRHNFGQQTEGESAEIAKDVDDKFCDLIRESVKELVFILAKRTGIARLLSSNKAGRVWAQGFTARNTGTFWKK